MKKNLVTRENEPYCSALDLAHYIRHRYKNNSKDNRDISEIKLQKSLYFLLAHWGGFARKSKDIQDSEFKPSTEILFNDEIQAWVYGAVVPRVYKYFKDTPSANDAVDIEAIETHISRDFIIKEYIDGLLDEIFRISDFKLVDIAQEDMCWHANYNADDKRHTQIIKHEDIINEYSKK